MMTDCAVICLPIPPESVRGNTRTHWAKKSKTTKLMKAGAKMVCLHLKLKQIDKPVIQRVFFVKGVKRKRDFDNFEIGCKAYIDGFTQARLWIDDSQCRYLPSLWREVGDKKPMVIFHIYEGWPEIFLKD